MIKQFFSHIVEQNKYIEINNLNIVYDVNSVGELESLLANKPNENLYFTGSLGEKTGKRCSDEEIISKRYVVFDFDIRSIKGCEGLSDEQVKAFGVSIAEEFKRDDFLRDFSSVVFSGNGIHIYYFSDSVDMKSKSVIYSRGYRKICDKIEMVCGYSPDVSCRNVSRIMRIPGSFNNKNGKHILTEFLYFEPKKSNILNEIMILGIEEDAPKYQPRLLISGGFWDQVGALNNQMVLERLSGSALVKGETYSFRKRSTGGLYIDVNGKEADCWIDTSGKIGSGKGASPTWIQWLNRYFGHSKADCAKWVKEAFPMHITVDVPRVIEIDDLLQDELEKQVMDALNEKAHNFTWGSKQLDIDFPPLQPSTYTVLVGEANVGKTPFALQMAIQNAARGKRILFLTLEMSGKALIARYLRNRAGITKLEWKTKNIPEDKRSNYEFLLKKIPFEQLIIKQAPSKDLFNMATLRDLIGKDQYDMVFIDNLGYIDGGKKTEYEALTDISRDIRQLVNESKPVVVALHHFNKGSGERSKPRALSAIRGTAKIEHDVDMIVQVWRDLDLDKDAAEEEKSEIMAIMHKDREFSDLGTTILHFREGLFS